VTLVVRRKGQKIFENGQVGRVEALLLGRRGCRDAREEVKGLGQNHELVIDFWCLDGDFDHKLLLMLTGALV